MKLTRVRINENVAQMKIKENVARMRTKKNVARMRTKENMARMSTKENVARMRINIKELHVQLTTVPLNMLFYQQCGRNRVTGKV